MNQLLIDELNFLVQRTDAEESVSSGFNKSYKQGYEQAITDLADILLKYDSFYFNENVLDKVYKLYEKEHQRESDLIDEKHDELFCLVFPFKDITCIHATYMNIETREEAEKYVKYVKARGEKYDNTKYTVMTQKEYNDLK